MVDDPLMVGDRDDVANRSWQVVVEYPARRSHVLGSAATLWSLVLMVVSSTGEVARRAVRGERDCVALFLLLGLALVFLIIDTNIPRIEDTLPPDHHHHHPSSSLQIVNHHTTSISSTSE